MRRVLCLLTIGIIAIGISCSNNSPSGPDFKLPEISSITITHIGQTSIECNVTVTSSGGAEVLERGVCWGTNPAPSLTDNKKSYGTGPGRFSASITDLTPGVTYYIRGYATNIVGTNYNADTSVATTADYGTITIVPVPDSIPLRWYLDGPYGYDYSGTTYTTYNDLVPGIYTLSWAEIPGWIKPATRIDTLDSFESLLIYGSYIPIFEIDSTGIMKDIDGNLYRTVKIGTKWWMAENLKVTHYRNGTPILNLTDNIEWFNCRMSAFCNYNNDANIAATYGILYNWYAVNDTNLLAPEGWHIASDSEFAELIDFAGGFETAGGKLKEAGVDHWHNPNLGAYNQYGFTALPGGVRGGTSFGGIGFLAAFWTSTANWNQSYCYRMHWSDSIVGRYAIQRCDGFSVRCVKD
jgi:uncharacterized protein (TIGR02145 family)